MKLNGKTLIVGLVLGLAAALVMGAMAPGAEGPGRYQITSTAVYAWVLDTQTGQVWTVERRDETTPSFVSTKPIEWTDYGIPEKNQKR